MAKVRDIINSNGTVSVTPWDSIAYVARQMKTSGSGVIPVCEKGKFQGLVTESDIVTGAVASASDLNRSISTVMTNYLPPVSPDNDVLQALDLMVASCARVLPVVEHDRLIGLLTLDDLARQSPALAALVYYRIAKAQAFKTLIV